MSDIHPLPTLTRCYHGEDIVTYAARHATRNGLTVREQGHITSFSPRDPARLTAWRALGHLHRSAFEGPRAVSGQWVTDRDLCRGCSAGNTAHGRLPDVGLVCLRHRRWLGSPEQPHVVQRHILAAEAAFRTLPVPKGELFDSPVLRFAGGVAARGADPDELQTQRERTSLPQEALLYPSQIRVARLLTTTRFLDALLAQTAGLPPRPQTVRIAIQRIFPKTDEAFRLRAEIRVNEVADRLTQNIGHASSRGYVLLDEWNLLRHVTSASQEPHRTGASRYLGQGASAAAPKNAARERT